MTLTVLVTGAEGQVGTALMGGGHDGNVWVGLSRAELDLCSRASIARAMEIHRPDVVVNAAAYTAVDRAEDDRDRAFLVNADGPRYLAEACLAHQAALIHISTDYVFDGRLGRPAREEDPCCPVGVYGQSKYAGEEAIRQVGVRHLCLRTSWIFSGTHPCFPRSILKAARQRDVLNVVEDQFGGPTSADALAHVIRCVLARYAQSTEIVWGTYHFAQKPDCSWFEFAQAIIRMAAIEDAAYAHVRVEPVSTEAYGARAPRPTDSRLSTEKINNNFSGIADSANWSADLQVAVQAILHALKDA